MKNKKIVKQLMAVGVQRNDAAAFARTYRKIKATKMEALFPEIMGPAMPPVVYKHYPAQQLRAVVEMTDAKIRGFSADGVDLKQYVGEKLAREMTNHLYSSGVMQIESRRVYPNSTQFVTTVHVVLPQR